MGHFGKRTIANAERALQQCGTTIITVTSQRCRQYRRVPALQTTTRFIPAEFCGRQPSDAADVAGNFPTVIHMFAEIYIRSGITHHTLNMRLHPAQISLTLLHDVFRSAVPNSRIWLSSWSDVVYRFNLFSLSWSLVMLSYKLLLPQTMNPSHRCVRPMISAVTKIEALLCST